MELSLLVELKRRRVFRAMVGYGIAAFAVLQIVEPVMHGLHWPDAIVVLPFANLSGDKENEYFSDGMTEEIINALANVEGVRVVARTSAFSFKGKNLDVRQIGEELNVGTVLEGSV